MRIMRTHSAPKECLECGSEKLGKLSNIPVVENGGACMLCHDCGLWIEIGSNVKEPADLELVASLSICPHCMTVGKSKVDGGDEWCSECGLDPNIQEYSAPALAHLWKEGSGIKDFMQREVPLMDPARKMGKFLRTMCGPHCSFATACPQTVGNFVICYREENPSVKDCEDMSKKRSKKSRRERRRERLAAMENIKKAKQKAFVACAGAGWFEKVMYVKSPHPQQAGNTGSGSGT